MTSHLTNDPPPWKLEITEDFTNVDVSFVRLANRGFLIESTPDFTDSSFWNTPGNQPFSGAPSILRHHLWLVITGCHERILPRSHL